MTVKFFNQPFMLYTFNMTRAQSYSQYILHDPYTEYDYTFVTALKRIKPLKEEYGIYKTY